MLRLEIRVGERELPTAADRFRDPPGCRGDGAAPDAGGVGQGKELILTGDALSAREAAEAGLVNAVFPKETFDQEVRRIAEKVARKPPLALGMGKELVNRAFLRRDNRVGLEEVMDAQCSLIRTDDYREGVRAFFEKREPVFRGK